MCETTCVCWCLWGGVGWGGGWGSWVCRGVNSEAWTRGGGGGWRTHPWPARPPTHPPAASNPRCRCMKERQVGRSTVAAFQAGGAAPGGRRGIVSQHVAFDTTALRALITPPPRSRTPAARPPSITMLLPSVGCGVWVCLWGGQQGSGGGERRRGGEGVRLLAAGRHSTPHPTSAAAPLHVRVQQHPPTKLLHAPAVCVWRGGGGGTRQGGREGESLQGALEDLGWPLTLAPTPPTHTLAPPPHTHSRPPHTHSRRPPTHLTRAPTSAALPPRGKSRYAPGLKNSANMKPISAARVPSARGGGECVELGWLVGVSCHPRTAHPPTHPPTGTLPLPPPPPLP